MIFLRILTFTVLTFTFLIALGCLAQVIGLPIEVGLPQWAPGCAGLLMLVIFPNDRHHITFFDASVALSRYLIAAVIPISAGLTIYFLSRHIEPESESSGVSNNLLLFFFLTPFGALGEEIGWRGYLNKRLELEGFRGIVSSLIVGIIWFGIHIPIMIQGGSALYIALYGTLVLSLSIVIYAVVQDTDFSVVVATVFHTALNWTNFLYVDRFYMVQILTIVALVWFVVAIACIFARRNLYLALNESFRSGYTAVG